MRELLPTLIATPAADLNPSAGGARADIELDFGAGDGARIIGVEFNSGNDGTTSDWCVGVSTDPNEAAPASIEAMNINTDVIVVDRTDLTLTTSGGTVIQSRFIDLSNEVIIVTRNLSFIGYDVTAGSLTAHVRVHYNQVQFSEDELRSITIVNR